jgi:hypothetical protein
MEAKIAETKHLVIPPRQYGVGGMIVHPVTIPKNPQLVLGIGGLVEDIRTSRLGAHLTDLALEGCIAMGIPTGTAHIVEDDIIVDFNILDSAERVSDALTYLRAYNRNRDIAVIAVSSGTIPLYELIASPFYGYNTPAPVSRIGLIAPFLGGKYYPETSEREQLEQAIAAKRDTIPITTPRDRIYGQRRFLTLEGARELYHADVIQLIKEGFVHGCPDTFIVRGKNDEKSTQSAFEQFRALHPGHKLLLLEEGHDVNPALYQQKLNLFITEKQGTKL